MSRVRVEPEVGPRYRTGGVLFVGRDPGQQEVDYLWPDGSRGRPFVGPAGYVLEEGLRIAGLQREEVAITNVARYRPQGDEFSMHAPEDVEDGLRELQAVISRLSPRVIVALGNEASWAIVPGWPGSSIWQATGITDRRGYFWQRSDGIWVLASIHPAAILHKTMPNAWLFEKDFERLGAWLRDRLPRVEFPTVKIARSYTDLDLLYKSAHVAADLETHPIFCAGFCGDAEPDQPIVVPEQYMEMALPVVTRPDVGLIWHHGLYDVRVLQKLGITPTGRYDDTMILWWALEPELAAKPESGGEDDFGPDPSSSRMTRKGLAFLASILWNVPWWKDYEDDPHSMHVLNGRDAWVTLRAFHTLMRECVKRNLVPQYERKIRQVPIALWMQERGLRVDEELRRERIRLLQERTDSLAEGVVNAGARVIQTLKPPAFLQTKTCECCGGRVRAKRCWRCAGLPKRPERKSDYLPLLELSSGGTLEPKKATVARLRKLIPPCRVCNGTGRREYYGGRESDKHPGWAWNPFSTNQMLAMLDAIRVPKSVWGRDKNANEETLLRILEWSQS